MSNADVGQRFDLGPALASVRAERLRRQAGPSIPAPRTLKKSEWPPDYDRVLAWRQMQLARFELQPELIASAKKFYRRNPIAYINHWCDTYDPRNAKSRGGSGDPVVLPMVLFQRQDDLATFVMSCVDAGETGLVEKSRDMGATWVCLGLSVAMWLFWDMVSIGWGSRKQELVDRIGDPSSLFEKARMLIRQAPKVFMPSNFDDDAHLNYMRCLNPETGSSIIGEIGDDIGRGGRTLVYFVDEAAHLERPEKVEAALLENTRCRMDLSSVSGLGTVFYRKRETGEDWERGQPIVRGQTNVFVMDWSDHPKKSQQWHDTQKAKLTNQGLGHVFAREVDRDYAAAAEGIIIPQDWVRAAVDADKKLKFDDSGGNVAALDVADGGLDNNAYARRKGIILRTVKEWGERDTGATCRRAIAECEGYLPIALQYDSVGVGSGIKAEYNRLTEDKKIPKGLILVPWSAGDSVLHPKEHILTLPDGRPDPDSMTNEDFYANLKAQGWWMLRRRFELTYKALNEPDFTWKVDDLISLDSSTIDPGVLRKLMKELSQPVYTHNTRMKLLVDKQPEGTRSPNLGDATMMCFWPWEGPPLPTVSVSGPIVIRGS